MKISSTILRYAAIAIIVLAVGALLGWYYFLRGSETQTSAADAARGYGSVAPSFTGSTGSDYNNLISTLGAEPGVAATSSSSRLWEVSEVPTAGFGWIGSSTATLYFVERSSGYVFEADTSGRDVVRLTDTLRPKIYQAFVSKGGSIIERSVDDSGTLITFSGKIATSSDANASATSSPDTLEGNDLPQGIREITADPASGTLFYAIPGPSGVSLVSTAPDGTKEQQLFSSTLEGWRLLAPGDGSLVLLQAPLDGVEGYAYRLGKGGALSLLAQAPGLTISPRASSGALLFGSSGNGVLSLFAQSGAGATPDALSIQTVADKCAWAPGTGLIAYCSVPQSIPSQQFLNDWYKGIVHTSDEFYEVDASTASTTLIYNPAGDTDAQLDVEDLSVDPTGQYLAFIDAQDQSLWVLRIAQ